MPRPHRRQGITKDRYCQEQFTKSLNRSHLHIDDRLRRVVVWFSVGVAGDAKSEEALVAGLAAVGTLKKQMVKRPLQGASSLRPVNLVAAALRALGKLLLRRRAFRHGEVLRGEDSYYNFQWPE